ncbi:MAG: hypothetical protein K0Q66_1137 [Chitinophagaceae bacterium]|jgi:hypothetical protein|nr:hypothetical protein [Chitinophagaceae bacterium]
MKLYSPESPVSREEEVENKPAPYNWLVLLVIFIAYIVFSFTL